MDRLKEKILKQISGIFVNSDFSQITSFLNSCRKIIERDELSDRYPILKFYSTWDAHSQLDQNSHAFALLDKINIGFHELPLPPDQKIDEIFPNYMDVVINALSITKLLEELIDFIHFQRINMPIMGEGDISINGKVLPLPNHEDKTKFLIANGNLDVGIPFITATGNGVRKEFLVRLFHQLEGIKLKYPDKAGKKMKGTQSKIALIGGKVNDLKENIPGLDVGTDYSNPWLINSFVIDQVVDNQVHTAMEMRDQEVTVRGFFYI